MFKKFLNDTNGATGIEYALIAALVSVASIAAMTGLGTETMMLFDYVAENVVQANK